MLVVIAIIGVLASIAGQYVGDLGRDAVEQKNRKNAQQVASLSAAVAALGVAHVLPDSMGGVEASIRLLEQGITVPSGANAGQRLSLQGFTDVDISGASQFLRVAYEANELSLVTNF